MTPDTMEKMIVRCGHSSVTKGAGGMQVEHGRSNEWCCVYRVVGREMMRGKSMDNLSVFHVIVSSRAE